MGSALTLRLVDYICTHDVVPSRTFHTISRDAAPVTRGIVLAQGEITARYDAALVRALCGDATVAAFEVGHDVGSLGRSSSMWAA